MHYILHDFEFKNGEKLYGSITRNQSGYMYIWHVQNDVIYTKRVNHKEILSIDGDKKWWRNNYKDFLPDNNEIKEKGVDENGNNN
jgi:hypothetical protein